MMHPQLRSLAECQSQRDAEEEDVEFYCTNNEYGCDNKVAEEDTKCDPCQAAYDSEAAYWRQQYDRSPRYSRAEIEDCYSESCERNKREIALSRLEIV